MVNIVEPERKTEITNRAEVVVAGAGVAGVCAAVASARAGADTLLIERYAFPGGTSTAGLMSGITNFYYTGRDQRVVGGIALEVVERLEEKKGVGPGPFTSEVPQIPNDPELMKLVLIEMLEESGVKILYHTIVVGADVVSGRVAHLIVENKGGRSAIAARIFIDATGDADLVSLSRGEVEDVNSNGSLEIRMVNVDVDELIDYLVDHPGEYDDYGDVSTCLADCRKNWEEKGLFHLPHGNGRRMSIVQDAIDNGEYPREFGVIHGLDAFGMYGLRKNRTVIVNTGFVNGALLDPEFLSRAETDARRAARLAADFLIKKVPGFAGSFLADTATQIGIRMTRRIRGHYTLTREECEAYSKFEDVIAVATERIMGGPRYEEGFDIPLRILIPRGIDGILVASGKCVSTEPPGQLRGQVACMQMGQACGVAAASCSSIGVLPTSRDLKDIQKRLLVQGVNLGDPGRLSQLGLGSI
jgi:hypothetical protein